MAKGALSAVRIKAGLVELEGELALPDSPMGMVVFAHGSGSSRHSPRNRYVAHALQEGRVGTLLMDLLTPAEDQIDSRTAELRFNVELLAERLIAAVDWAESHPALQGLNVGLFGASTGAAAALVAAAARPAQVSAARPSGSGRHGSGSGAGCNTAHCGRERSDGSGVEPRSLAAASGREGDESRTRSYTPV